MSKAKLYPCSAREIGRKLKEKKKVASSGTGGSDFGSFHQPLQGYFSHYARKRVTGGQCKNTGGEAAMKPKARAGGVMGHNHLGAHWPIWNTFV